VKAGAKLRASSATTIRVVGRVLVSNGGEVGPTPGAFAVDPFTAVVGARHFVTFYRAFVVSERRSFVEVMPKRTRHWHRVPGVGRP
jgi:hypothetical protein